MRNLFEGKILRFRDAEEGEANEEEEQNAEDDKCVVIGYVLENAQSIEGLLLGLID